MVLFIYCLQAKSGSTIYDLYFGEMGMKIMCFAARCRLPCSFCHHFKVMKLITKAGHVCQSLKKKGVGLPAWSVCCVK